MLKVTQISQTDNGKVPNPIQGTYVCPVVFEQDFANCYSTSAIASLDKHLKICIYNKGGIAVMPKKRTPAIYQNSIACMHSFFAEKHGKAYSNLPHTLQKV
jgi:hypothetical protein